MTTENLFQIFENAFGQYNQILRKVAAEKIRENAYDNDRDLKLIMDQVFENYPAKWNKPPDWPAIKELIGKYNEQMRNMPCSQHLAIGYKKPQVKIEAPAEIMTEEEMDNAREELRVLLKRLSEAKRVY